MNINNIDSGDSPHYDLTERFLLFIRNNKYPLIVTLGFFLMTSYITFFHHDYWFEYDGIYYLHQGEEALKGNGENGRLIGSTIVGPIIYAVTNYIIKDGFLTLKLFALFGGTLIIFVSYFIIRNIFDWKIALVGQLLIAVNARFILQTTWAINEQLSLLFIFLSLYFMTKKQLRVIEIILIGILLGISFIIRYQGLFVVISFLIFLIIRNKNYRINLMHCGFVVGIFLIIASPLFLYNYFTYGKIMDSDPNYYILDSKFQTQEWRNILLNASAHERDISGIFLDIDLFLKNYFYNLFYHNANSLFNFNTWINLSVMPMIPFLGIVPILFSVIYILKIKFTKKILLGVIGSFLLVVILIIQLGDIKNHFFALIIIPIIFLGVLHIRHIEKNLLPLLILSVVFFVGTSIIPIPRADQLFPMWMIVPILSSLFLVEIVPKRLSNVKLTNHSKELAWKVAVILVILVLLGNVIFSYRTILVYFYGELPSDLKNELNKFFNTEPRHQAGKEIKEIGDILAKQPGIKHSYVMSDSVAYSYYAKSKFLFTSFQGGIRGDAINKFVTRENWSDYDVYFSNLNSHPPDRKNIYRPIPDYIIYHKPREAYDINPLDREKNQYEDLKILADPTNPKIPSNFEFLYKDNRTGVTVYKINHIR